jgi:hypothetical protein
MTPAEILDDLVERCRKADAELALATATLDSFPEAALRMIRLYAKAEGVRLALSYIEDARRTYAAESQPSGDEATGRAPARPTITP